MGTGRAAETATGCSPSVAAWHHVASPVAHAGQQEDTLQHMVRQVINAAHGWEGQRRALSRGGRARGGVARAAASPGAVQRVCGLQVCLT